MTHAIQAQDREFAVATGANLTRAPGTSGFDAPPAQSTGLTIAALSDDAAPFLFEIGDRYALTVAGPTPLSLKAAEVIRSDYLDPGQGAVVFEGVATGGATVRILWTPHFDLHAWYEMRRAEDASPSFFTRARPPETGGHVCFAAGTRIATPTGARPVETLCPGDLIATEDSGPQPILWIGARPVLGTGPAAPVRLPAGVLDNTRPLVLSQNHRVLIAGAAAELMFGTPELWVPAKALIGCAGARLSPQKIVTYYHLLLPRHEVLRAEGAAAESLFLGDLVGDLADDFGGDFGGTPRNDPAAALDAAARLFPDLGRADPAALRPARPILTGREARLLTLRRFPDTADPAPWPMVAAA